MTPLEATRRSQCKRSLFQAAKRLLYLIWIPAQRLFRERRNSGGVGLSLFTFAPHVHVLRAWNSADTNAMIKVVTHARGPSGKGLIDRHA